MAYRPTARFDITNVGAGSQTNGVVGVSGNYTGDGNSFGDSVTVGDYLFSQLSNGMVFRWRITNISSASPFALTIDVVIDDPSGRFPSSFESTPISAGIACIVGAKEQEGPALVPSSQTLQIPDSLLAAVATANDFYEAVAGGLTPAQIAAIAMVATNTAQIELNRDNIRDNTIGVETNETALTNLTPSSQSVATAADVGSLPNGQRVSEGDLIVNLGDGTKVRFLQDVPLPVGTAVSSDADANGVVSITTSGSEPGGTDFGLTGEGHLIVRTKTDSNVILDTGRLANKTTGPITFGGNTIGSFEIGGTTQFNTNAISLELGLCCFEAEYVAYNDAGEASPTVTSQFEGQRVVDLTAIWGVDGGRPVGESDGTVGVVSWNQVSENANAGAFGSNFNYLLASEFLDPVAPATVGTYVPGLLTVDFGRKVKNVKYRVNDIDSVPSGRDFVQNDATLAGAGVSLLTSEIANANGYTITASGTGQLISSSGNGGTGSALDNVAELIVDGELDKLTVEVRDNPNSPGESNRGHGVGISLISFECCDPAL